MRSGCRQRADQRQATGAPGPCSSLVPCPFAEVCRSPPAASAAQESAAEAPSVRATPWPARAWLGCRQQPRILNLAKLYYHIRNCLGGMLAEPDNSVRMLITARGRRVGCARATPPCTSARAATNVHTRWSHPERSENYNEKLKQEAENCIATRLARSIVYIYRRGVVSSCFSRLRRRGVTSFHASSSGLAGNAGDGSPALWRRARDQVAAGPCLLSTWGARGRPRSS